MLSELFLAVASPHVEKAQSVEMELMDSHREEASQMKKVIAQKEDDLKRTVQRYEEILQVWKPVLCSGQSNSSATILVK